MSDKQRQNAQADVEMTKDDKDDDDLDLSDVPMDELEDDNEDEEEDQEEAAAEADELFANIIEEENRYILENIFANISKAKVKLNDEDEVAEEPEEELDDEERLRLLMDHLDPQQMSRYEYYRRTAVNKSNVKKIANTVLNQSVSNNVAIVLSGVAKVFLGEIVEKAKLVKKRYDKANLLIKLNEKRELNEALKNQISLLKKEPSNSSRITSINYNIERIKSELRKLDLRNINEKGPILPEHIREAWRLYQLESGTAPSGQWRTQGERNGMMFR